MDDDRTDDALGRLARPLVDRPPIPRTPLAELEQRARRRTGRRRAITATVVVLALVGVGGLMARAGTPDASVETQTTPTTELPPSWQGDLVIYLQPNASPGQVQAIRDSLVADPDVHRILYQSHAAVYEDFRCLFADSPEMVDNVTSDILPPNFRLFLDGDPAAINQILLDYGGDHAGVRDISPVPSPGPPPTAVRSDCPQVGEWIK